MNTLYNRHIMDDGREIRIELVGFNNSYMVYIDGQFEESLDNYDIEDRKRLKLLEYAK